MEIQPADDQMDTLTEADGSGAGTTTAGELYFWGGLFLGIILLICCCICAVKCKLYFCKIKLKIIVLVFRPRVIEGYQST